MKIMKRNLLYLFSLLLVLGSITGCSRDEKCAVVTPEQYVGVYKGFLDVELVGTRAESSILQKIYVAGTGNHVTLALKNFKFGQIELGDIILKNVKVIHTVEGVNFVGEDMLDLEVGKCNVAVDADVVNNKMTSVINVDVKDLGQTVKVNFVGDKLAVDQSSSAEIKEFTIDGAEVEFDADTKTYKVTVVDLSEEELSKIVPSIQISDKAKIVPAIGEAINLNEETTYVVTSEDEINTVEYKVVLAKNLDLVKIDFEDWKEEKVKKIIKYTPYYAPEKLFASSDDGLGLLALFGQISELCIEKTEDAVSGKSAAAIKTISCEKASFAPNSVAAGSLFLGDFELNISNPLLSTQFGIEYTKKPVAVNFHYKYKSGDSYWQVIDPSEPKVVEKIEGKKDNFAITAVLYEFDGKNTLTGEDLNDKSKAVAYAQLVGGEQDVYTKHQLKLEYLKEYDASKKYKFALVFSSSAEGDKFCGAPGSVLQIDDVEIIQE